MSALEIFLAELANKYAYIAKNIIVIIRATNIPTLYIDGIIKFCSQFKWNIIKINY